MAGYTLEQKQAIVKQLSDAYREGEAEILRKLANGSLSEWSYSLEGQAGQRRLLLKGADQSKADEWMEAPQ